MLTSNMHARTMGDSLLAAETRRCVWLSIQVFHGKSIISDEYFEA